MDTMNMSPNDYIKMIESKDSEIRRLNKVISEVTSNIRIVGRQNTSLKKKCDRYEKILNEAHTHASESFKKMEPRTCNIIRACKGSLYPEIDGRLERVKTYLSVECGYPKENYTDDLMEQILLNAVFDYIDVCDRPSVFLRLVLDCVEKDLSLVERICIAFTLVQVKRDDKFINGFDAEYFE